MTSASEFSVSIGWVAEDLRRIIIISSLGGLFSLT